MKYHTGGIIGNPNKEGLDVPFVLEGGYSMVPVKGPNGEIQLYDIYIDTPRRWIGSRRTVEHCHETLRNHGVTP